MGNFTLRTDEQQDAIIRDAQEAMGVSTASKALLMAISEYIEDQQTIKQLRRELEQERSRSRQLSSAIGDFQDSMTRMFSLK